MDDPQRKALLLLVILIAGGSTFLAWPRLHASINYLPVDTALNRYYAGESISKDQLPALISRSEASLEIHDHSRFREGLSVLLYLHGLDEERLLHDRLISFKDSRQASIMVLSRAPSKPATWLRLARLHTILQDQANEVIKALEMSIRSGPVEPALLLGRLELGYRFADEMGSESLDLLRGQTRLAWTLREKEFFNALETGTINPEAVRSVMSETDPVLMDDVEAKIARRR